jgi:hypothetical protein
MSTNTHPGGNAPPDPALDRLDPVHRRIATVALRAAARHGFALGGSNALLAHGIISRPALDVNLLVDRKDGVRAAAEPVLEALRQNGFTAQSDSQSGGLAGWSVTGHGGRHRELRLACSPRSRDPVPTDDGPVVHLEDAAGGKVGMLARRGQVCDYADTAALLGRWTPVELAGLPAAWTRPWPPVTWPRSPGGWTGCPTTPSAPTDSTSQDRTSGPPWSGNGSPPDRATPGPSASGGRHPDAPATTLWTVADDRPGHDNSGNQPAGHRPPGAQPTRRVTR